MSICSSVMLSSSVPWREVAKQHCLGWERPLTGKLYLVCKEIQGNSKGLLRAPRTTASLNAGASLATGTSSLLDCNPAGTYGSKKITKPGVSHTGTWDLHNVSQLRGESPFPILSSLCYFYEWPFDCPHELQILHFMNYKYSILIIPRDSCKQQYFAFN